MRLRSLTASSADSALLNGSRPKMKKKHPLSSVRMKRAHEDKAYSLCDAASFVVMKRLGIRKAIAFDRHFREYERFIIL
jgi:hypothetical protein